MRKKISIVIPTFNRKTYLDFAVESFVDFTFNDDAYELIIVDDFSTDNTFEFLSVKYADYLVSEKIKIIRLPCNLGPIAARNAGVLVSSGIWIGFMDSDNRILKADKVKFEEVLESTDFSLVLFRCVDESGLLLGKIENKSTWTYSEVLNIGLPECFGFIKRDLFLFGYNSNDNEKLRRFEAIGFYRIMRKCGALYLSNVKMREYSFSAPNRLSSREGTIKDAHLMFRGNLMLVYENYRIMKFTVLFKNIARIFYYGFYTFKNLAGIRFR
jgi:glycosyltransferase involved in cell wall biosynthesis